MPRTSKQRTSIVKADDNDLVQLDQADSNPQYEEQTTHTPKQWSGEDFVLGRALGDGQFGRVYQATERQSGHQIALKYMNKLELLRNNALMQIKREIEIHSHLIHPNILRLYGFYMEDQDIILIMELLGGSVFNQLQLFGKFTNSRAAAVLHQITSSLAYLHNLDIVHRDIKSENILYTHVTPVINNIETTQNSTLHQSYKLADFGWATYTNRKRRTTLCGTKDFLSPEMILGWPYTTSVDMWSLGCLFYETLVGHPPFDENLYIPNSLQGIPVFGLEEWDKRFIKETSCDVGIYLDDIRSEIQSHKKTASGDVDFSRALADFQTIAASPRTKGSKSTPKKNLKTADPRLLPSLSQFTPIKSASGTNVSSIRGQFETHATPNEKLKGLPLNEQFKINLDYQVQHQQQHLPNTPSRRAIFSPASKTTQPGQNDKRTKTTTSTKLNTHGVSRQSTSKYHPTMMSESGAYDSMNPRTWDEEELERAVSGKFPAHDVPLFTLKRIITCDIQYPPFLDPLAIDLLSRMLIFDPQKRLTAEQVLEHPYLAHFYDKSTNGGLDLEEEYQQFFNNGQYSVLHYDWVQCHIIRKYLAHGLEYQLPVGFPMYDFNVDALFHIASSIIDEEDGFDDLSDTISLPPNWIEQRKIENILDKNQNILNKSDPSSTTAAVKKARFIVKDYQQRLANLISNPSQLSLSDLLSKLDFTVHTNLMSMISELQDQIPDASQSQSKQAQQNSIASTPLKSTKKPSKPLSSKFTKFTKSTNSNDQQLETPKLTLLQRHDSTLHTYETAVAPLRYSSTDTHVQLQPQSNPKLTTSMKKAKLTALTGGESTPGGKKRKASIDPYQLDDDLMVDAVEDATLLAQQIAQLISPQKSSGKETKATTPSKSTSTSPTLLNGEDDLFFKALLHTSIDDDIVATAAHIDEVPANVPKKRLAGVRRFVFTQKTPPTTTQPIESQNETQTQTQTQATPTKRKSIEPQPTAPTSAPGSAKKPINIKPTKFLLRPNTAADRQSVKNPQSDPPSSASSVENEQNDPPKRSSRRQTLKKDVEIEKDSESRAQMKKCHKPEDVQEQVLVPIPSKKTPLRRGPRHNTIQLDEDFDQVVESSPVVLSKSPRTSRKSSKSSKSTSTTNFRSLASSTDMDDEVISEKAKRHSSRANSTKTDQDDEIAAPDFKPQRKSRHRATTTPNSEEINQVCEIEETTTLPTRLPRTRSRAAGRSIIPTSHSTSPQKPSPLKFTKSTATATPKNRSRRSTRAQEEDDLDSEMNDVQPSRKSTRLSAARRG